MERRAFLASGAAALTAASATSAADTPQIQPAASPGAASLLELRRYRLRSGAMASRLGGHVKNALVPALNRAGIAPAGVFNVSLGAESPTLHLLLPHHGLDSVASLDERLAADAEYRKASAAYGLLPSGDPPFLRCDSSLHAAVPSFPGIAAPSGAAAGSSRLFELRTYRSHSEAASRKKIEMFEAGGELAIFRRVGLTVVFFSRDLVGAGLPSLTYMLVFPDALAREKTWAVFREDPEWLKLKSRPEYTDSEVVCGITAILLRPADSSQI